MSTSQSCETTAASTYQAHYLLIYILYELGIFVAIWQVRKLDHKANDLLKMITALDPRHFNPTDL